MTKGSMAPTRRSELVRRAVSEDAPGIADVHVATWQTAYASIFPESFLSSLDRGRRETWWRGYLGRGGIAHVVDVDGVVAGFCSPGASEDAGWGEIFSIYVRPEHWGGGYGKALLDAGEQTLREAGFGRGLLWVLGQNARARRFYERQGWRLGRPFRLEEIGGVQVEELRYEIEL